MTEQELSELEDYVKSLVEETSKDCIDNRTVLGLIMEIQKLKKDNELANAIILGMEKTTNDKLDEKK